jgi:hypothetical protein
MTHHIPDLNPQKLLWEPEMPCNILNYYDDLAKKIFMDINVRL